MKQYLAKIPGLTWLWQQSLWLTLPLSLLLTVWLVLGWSRFSQIETSILPQYNASLSKVLEYESRQLLVGWRDKTGLHKADLPKQIRPLQLVVAKRDIKALNSALPQSGKHYVKGKLLERNNDVKIKLRYRGNNPRHWRGEKKSMRIRVQNDKLWQQMSTFELLAPADESLLGAYFGSRLSKKMGLLGGKTELVWLYLNGESRGLYLLVETIDEQTLVNSARMPGDIYAGEVAKRDAFAGADNRLFYNAGLWQKLAYNSDYPQTDRDALALLVDWLTAEEVDYFQLQQLVDYPDFARFYLFHQLLNSTNIDRYHNWRLYFDHSAGRFFPVIWDPEGWPEQQIAVEKSRLMSVLLADPEFNRIVSQQYQLLQMPTLLSVFSEEAKALVENMRNVVAADPYSSIDLHYFDQREFDTAANQLLLRMAKAFEQSWPEPEAISAHLEPQVWHGEMRFDGINHIREPVIIAPGSRILLGPGALLVFHQQVQINGTEQSMVEITAASDEPFAAFVLKGQGADGSTMRYCRFSKGSLYKNPVVNYTAMLSLHEVKDVTIDHCRFADNQRADDMVHGVYADMVIRDSIFSNAVADGLDLELSSAVIENSYFNRNGREGVDAMHSDVVIRNVHFVDNFDTALSVGQKSRIRLENSSIKGSKNGVLVKDSSILRVSHSDIFANERIAELKQSNDNYADGGLLFVYRSKLFDNRRHFAVEKNSKMNVFDSYLSPRFDVGKKRIVIDVSTNDFQSRLGKGEIQLHKQDKKLMSPLEQMLPSMPFNAQRGRLNE